MAEDRDVVRPLRPRETQPAALRSVMAQFATGVTVLAAGNGETCHGMTANAFSSVSLDPPMVLCCVARTSRMHDIIVSAGSFAVSILGADQQELAKHFANGQRPSGREQFDTVRWKPGELTGAPVLTDALAWLECELAEMYGGGDHSIFLGAVLSAERRESGTTSGSEALLFYGGGFHRFGKSA